MSQDSRTPADVALWPVRRVLDPRFADLARRLHSVIVTLRDETDALRKDVAPLEDAVQRELAAMREISSQVSSRLDASDARLASIDERLAVLVAQTAR